jgi:hypothetical protein
MIQSKSFIHGPSGVSHPQRNRLKMLFATHPGRPLGLLAIPVFLGLLAGSLLFGPVGFILAVPVLAVRMCSGNTFEFDTQNAE